MEIKKEELRLKSKLLVLTMIMALGMTFTAFADDEEGFREISNVHLDVSSSYNGRDEAPTVEVTTSDEGYEVSDIVITNDNGEWTSSIAPRVEIYLTTTDDYTFKYGSKSHVKFSGDTVKCLSVKKDSADTELVIKIDIKPDGTDIGAPSNLEWVNGKKAKWISGYSAKSYEVALYKGSERKFVGTTDKTEYDFTSLIQDNGNYKFKVRSVGTRDKKSEWNESYDLTVANNDSNQHQVGWVQDQVGWWYRNADGSYPVHNWQLINDKWYYFGGNGYMMTGWVQLGDKWYYLDPSGAMTTDWQFVNGKWYLMRANGEMIANEIVNGYVLGPDGAWVE